MEADTDGQSDTNRMLCAIGLQIAAVVEEVLQRRLQIDAKMGRKVVLQTKTKGCCPLVINVEGCLFIKGYATIVDVIDLERTVYRQFQHGPCRGIETEVCLAEPLPAEADWDAKIV